MMPESIRVSVAMAAYNGEKYIEEQIESILCNLGSNDELVISDDGSTDSTCAIIERLMCCNKNIRLIQGPHNGVIANFENAIKHTKGEYIFLSDQDDIWKKNKAEVMLRCFSESNASCVVHDAEIIDANMQVICPSFYSFRNSGAGILHNLIKNSYIGCCMAFRRELLKKILPIPKHINMHDQWIGLLSDKFGKSVFITDVLISYRRHDSNASSMKHYPLKKMIQIRYDMLAALLRRK